MIHYAGYCDAFLVGLLIGVIDFALLPTFMFITVIQSQSLMNNGVRYWAHSLGLLRRFPDHSVISHAAMAIAG
ncbi:MAG: hypothetical protein IPK95_07055 [Cellvibrionales bacterium]|nr:hypothetical protein [Cellvibrionales bacterium]